MRTPIDEAFDVAMETAGAGLLDAKGVTSPRRSRRPKWAGQAAWDKENILTVSCRLPKEEAQRLIRCCKEAGISRHRLIKYMLCVWCSAWESSGVAIHGKQ